MLATHSHPPEALTRFGYLPQAQPVNVDPFPNKTSTLSEVRSFLREYPRTMEWTWQDFSMGCSRVLDQYRQVESESPLGISPDMSKLAGDLKAIAKWCAGSQMRQNEKKALDIVLNFLSQRPSDTAVIMSANIRDGYNGTLNHVNKGYIAPKNAILRTHLLCPRLSHCFWDQPCVQVKSVLAQGDMNIQKFHILDELEGLHANMKEWSTTEWNPQATHRMAKEQASSICDWILTTAISKMDKGGVPTPQSGVHQVRIMLKHVIDLAKRHNYQGVLESFSELNAQLRPLQGHHARLLRYTLSNALSSYEWSSGAASIQRRLDIRPERHTGAHFSPIQPAKASPSKAKPVLHKPRPIKLPSKSEALITRLGHILSSLKVQIGDVGVDCLNRIHYYCMEGTAEYADLTKLNNILIKHRHNPKALKADIQRLGYSAWVKHEVISRLDSTHDADLIDMFKQPNILDSAVDSCKALRDQGKSPKDAVDHFVQELKSAYYSL